MPIKQLTASLLFSAFCTSITNAQWIDFNDRSAIRLQIATGIDPQEKDCRVGDFDRDGWDDIVIVRKAPFDTESGDTDLLLMNRSGVLTDETPRFAPEFLTNFTDARDVFVTDVDGDDWPDLILANTFGQQPVCYMNRGEDGAGQWLGFVDESSTRFPHLDIPVVQFCAVSAADLTGDGAPEIYFSNYERKPAIALDVLLLNDGSGHFTDVSDARLGDLRHSAFGTSVEIRDIENDGDLDIIKTSSLYPVPPWNAIGVFILFNDGSGHYDSFQAVPTESPYMFAVDDLNNDDWLDFYIVNDALDYTVLNAGYDESLADPLIFDKRVLFSERTSFLGGNVLCADLDNDGDMDVTVADVDLDIGICETSPSNLRKFAIFQNEGDASGTLIDPWEGEQRNWSMNVYDFAILDIDRDGKLDLFLGTCDGYSVLMQEHILAVSPQAALFEHTLAGFTNETILRLCNNGDQPIEITEISIVGDPYFSSNVNSISLDAYECTEVTISFAPPQAGNYTATLNITGDFTRELMLGGTAITPPEVLADQSPIDIVLAEGSATTRQISISNLGGSDLEFQIRVNLPGESLDRVLLLAEPSAQTLLDDIFSRFPNERSSADIASITDESLEDFETIFVALVSASISAETMEVLTRAVHSGKTLVVLGATTDPDFLQGLRSGLLNHVDRTGWKEPESPHFQITNSAHPLSDGLPTTHQFSSTSASWYRIQPDDSAAWVAASNGDGFPCLLSKQIGLGSLVYFTNWPLGVLWDNAIDRPILETIVSNATGFAQTAWLSATPRSMILPMGESVFIDLALNAIGQVAGNYRQAELILSTNDPLRPEIVIPISLEITDPSSPPSLVVTSVTDGVVTLALYGEPGITYEIQRSEDLVNWETISDLIAAAAPSGIVDTPEPETPRIFYRVARAVD